MLSKSAPGALLMSIHHPIAYHLTCTFPAPVGELSGVFDHVAILSATPPAQRCGLFGALSAMADTQAGSYALLRRNPHYWKLDDAGRPLPYPSRFYPLGLQRTVRRSGNAASVRRGTHSDITSTPSRLF